MIEKGAIVQCPGCRTEIYRLTQDCVHGEIIRASWFERIDPEQPLLVDGMKCICERCRSCWSGIVDGAFRIYIKEKGWMPPYVTP
jgi:hypothetical protein